MSQELISVETGLSKLPEIATIYQAAVAKINNATAAVNAFMAKIPEGITTDEQDAKAKELLDKCDVAFKAVEENEKQTLPYLEIIVKAIKEPRLQLDKKNTRFVAAPIVNARNAYATLKHQQEQERQRRIKLEQDIALEKIAAKNDIEQQLLTYFNNKLNSAVAALHEFFNKMTLEKFEEHSKVIRDRQFEYDFNHFQAFAGSFSPKFIKPEDIQQINIEVTKGRYADLNLKYVTKMNEEREGLVVRLESKKNELIKLKEFEEEQRRLQEEQRRLQEEKDKANAAERARIEAEQKELKRRQDEERERQELALKQQKEREDQERQEREAQRLKEEEEQKKLQETQKAQDEAVVMFSATAEIFTAPPVAAKIKKVVKLKTSEGILQLFNSWYIEEGNKLTPDELEKKLPFLFTHANKRAAKDIFITHPSIDYIDDVKAK